MKAPTLLAPGYPGPHQQRRRVDLDQICAAIEVLEGGVLAQQIEAVGIVIGDDSTEAAANAPGDEMQDLFGFDQIHGLAKQADPLLGPAVQPER